MNPLLKRHNERRAKATAARRAKLARLIEKEGIPTNQADLARRLGLSQATVSRDLAALRARWEKDAGRGAAARDRQLARLEEIVAAAREDRDFGTCVRAVMGQARLLGLDRPPLLTPEEQRGQWGEFLALVNVVAERHMAGDVLDGFRDDLRTTLAPMVGR